MQVNKLDNNCYYYTEIIDDNEANNLLNRIKINEGWSEAFVDERPYDENKAFWQTGNNMVKSDIKLNEFEK